ncbi:MAG TPA: c-type cytochrome [Gemmatimonadaceae bacterium]
MASSRLGCVVLALIVASTGCGPRSAKPLYQVPGGDAARGKLVLQTHACVACHTIPGVKYATGRVAPPLVDFGKRGFIGGVAPNKPENLIKWVMNPQALKPRTDMPNMDLTEQEARDVAAYLYTLH